MEKRSQLDAFEEFILDEVNEHRMYPSGRVWENIRTEVHGKRSWPALTIISLSILVALTVSTFVVTQKSTPMVKSLVVHHSSAPFAATTPTIELQIKKTRKQFPKAVIQVHEVVPEMPTQENIETTTGTTFSTINNEVTDELQTSIEAAATISTGDSQTKINKPSLLPAVIQQQVNNNFDLSSSANNKQKNRKYSVQFYATPSASFRVLSDQKVKELIQPSLIAIPLTAPISQTPTFNQAVRHRPDIGLELGLTFNYPVTNKLQFKTGLQVNIRQYQIDTYETGANAATLALVNGGRIQTVSVLSSYNNNVGFRSAQLNNKVYQIAMPIGLDYQVLKFKKFGIHTQATIQPTYNINKNVYLLSTDYANYAAGNEYVRKWNVNTSVGIQFSYQKGNTIWQLGPQIRYQTLPTYNNPYPIKENLIDYGFRIGWSKQFK
jgi:hypothetical protein